MSKVNILVPSLENLLICDGGTDEDLCAMYLTDKKNGTPRSGDDHEELEVLLESFSKQVEEIVNEAENTQVRE